MLSVAKCSLVMVAILLPQYCRAADKDRYPEDGSGKRLPNQRELMDKLNKMDAAARAADAEYPDMEIQEHRPREGFGAKARRKAREFREAVANSLRRHGPPAPPAPADPARYDTSPNAVRRARREAFPEADADSPPADDRADDRVAAGKRAPPAADHEDQAARLALRAENEGKAAEVKEEEEKARRERAAANEKAKAPADGADADGAGADDAKEPRVVAGADDDDKKEALVPADAVPAADPADRKGPVAAEAEDGDPPPPYDANPQDAQYPPFAPPPY